MPKYPNSKGEMIDKKIIDRNTAKAKELYTENFKDKHDYLFCERSMRSDLPLERSHIISVRMCQDSARCELAWCQFNIELLTREEHRRLEDMPNHKREEWYHFRRALLEQNLKLDKEVFVEFEKYYNSQNEVINKLSF